MRSAIILGTVVALLGFGSAAQASDRSGLNDDDAAQVTREVAHDDRGGRDQRYEHGKRSGERHHKSRDHRRTSYENHEGREHR